MSAKRGKTMHGLTRAILICLGGAFVLFGGLFVAACIGTLAQGANNAAAAKVGVTVQAITTIVFALVTIAGVFMIWLGLRRGGGEAAAKEAARVSALPGPAKDDTDVFVRPAPVGHAVGPGREAPLVGVPEINQEAGEEVYAVVCAELGSESHGGAHRAPCSSASEFGSVDGDLGRFIARCGPELNGLMYHYVSAGVYFAIGLVCVIAPQFMEFAIDPGLAVLIPAGACVFFALVHLWTPLFGKPQTIELFEFGIVERLGDQTRRIEIATISHLRVQEFYEHRFADRTFLIKAQIQGQPQLEFTTALRGDGEQIVDYLASAVPQTEFVEFKV